MRPVLEREVEHGSPAERVWPSKINAKLGSELLYVVAVAAVVAAAVVAVVVAAAASDCSLVFPPTNGVFGPCFAMFS